MTIEQVKAAVRLIVPLAAGAATAFGLSVDAEAAYSAVCGIVTVAAFIWSWWKNNNVTEAAQEAQGILAALKDAGETYESDALEIADAHGDNRDTGEEADGTEESEDEAGEGE